MPYISQEQKEVLSTAEDPFKAMEGPGDMNFVISTILNEYIKDKGLSYSTINEVIGILECAKLELYRRIAVPYENKKIAENGDVYNVE